uniref:Hes family bHLH transcription factor 3 n=1 Tax=Loxodonta africana TaxID=9785 RepID=G3SY12_LOXAF
RRPQTQEQLGIREIKISKPLMEKKRRARINVSLEQLKSLLEKHYSHQIRKRKLEKADILELSVKYMKSLQSSVQAPPVYTSPLRSPCLEYPSGFRGCLPGVSHLLRPSCVALAPAPSGLPLWLLPPGARSPRHPGCSFPAAPLARPPVSRRRPEIPGPGLRVWRPW